MSDMKMGGTIDETLGIMTRVLRYSAKMLTVVKEKIDGTRAEDLRLL